MGLVPLIMLAFTAFATMLIDLSSEPKPRRQNALAIIGLLLSALGTVPAYTSMQANQNAFAYWGGILYVDMLALMFTVLSCLTGALVLLFSIDYLEERREHPGEFITLIPFICLGLLIACSTKELLTFFLAFELMSLPLYVLAAWGRFHIKSSEAGYKYFINGAVSSAIMFYGISLVFGTVGSTFFDQIVINFDSVSTPRHAFVLGCMMILGAMFFKIAVAPFHMWAPDVYEGAPSPAGMFISTAPKATLIAFLLRIIWTTFALQSIEFRLDEVWVITLCSLAIVSMCWGNLAALSQTNIKRLMAFSGIAQIGYTLLGVMSASRYGSASEGAAAAIFYITVYSFANLAVWAVIVMVGYQRGTSEIADYRGLAKTNPFLAFVMLIALFSLAGAPPLAGFVGKFFLFRAVFWAHSSWWWVVLLALVNSVISLYYYFGVLKPIYFGEPPTDADNQTLSPLRVSFSVKFGLGLCLIMVAVGGLYPRLMEWSLTAGSTLLSGKVTLP